MIKEELLKQLSATLWKIKVQELAALATTDDLKVSDVLELCFYHQKEVAFRAAWILEHIEFEAPTKFLSVLPLFLNRYSDQKNASCQRHFTKIMMRLTKKKSSNTYQSILNDYDFEKVVNSTFEWLISETTPVAVKVNCIEILVNLHKYFDWIAEELEAQIQFLLKNGGPAIQSRGKKMLQLLSKRV